MHENDDFCFILVKVILKPPLSKLYNDLAIKDLKYSVNSSIRQHKEKELYWGFQTLKEKFTSKICLEFANLVSKL